MNKCNVKPTPKLCCHLIFIGSVIKAVFLSYKNALEKTGTRATVMKKGSGITPCDST